MIDVAFIGVGNIATSIITGLVDGGLAQKNIVIAGKNKHSLEKIHSRYPNLQKAECNLTAAGNSHILFLCVKPDDMQSLCHEIKDSVDSNTIIISVAAGLPLELISKWFESDQRKIVRMMPNTPIEVSKGVALMCSTPQISVATVQEELNTLLRPSALPIWLDREEQMNAGTAICGSGPAYFFYLIWKLQTVLDIDEQIAIQLLSSATDKFIELNTEYCNSEKIPDASLNVTNNTNIDPLLSRSSALLLSFTQEWLALAEKHFSKLTALDMVTATVVGALALAQHKGGVKRLCEQVTSKGGTTEAALEILQTVDLEMILENDVEKMRSNDLIRDVVENMFIAATTKAENLARGQ